MDNRAWDQGWCSTLAIASLLMGGIACSGPKVTTETSKELPRYQIRTVALIPFTSLGTPQMRDPADMREEHFDDPRAHIQGCLNTIDRKRAEAVLRDLIGQLKAAEREGRVEDARALNAQVNELRSQKAGRPAGTLFLVKE